MPSDLLRVMLHAAYAAGEGLLVDRARIETLDVRSKEGPADVFSEADLRAEQTVRAALTGYRPDYGFLGEEGGLEPGRDPSFVWMVDPLDGTTNFLTGSPLFATKTRHDRFLAEMERLTTRVAGIRRLGAGALDMAWVACGRHDAYWEQVVLPFLSREVSRATGSRRAPARRTTRRPRTGSRR